MLLSPLVSLLFVLASPGFKRFPTVILPWLLSTKVLPLFFSCLITQCSWVFSGYLSSCCHWAVDLHLQVVSGQLLHSRTHVTLCYFLFLKCFMKSTSSYSRAFQLQASTSPSPAFPSSLILFYGQARPFRMPVSAAALACVKVSPPSAGVHIVEAKTWVLVPTLLPSSVASETLL